MLDAPSPYFVYLFLGQETKAFLVWFLADVGERRALGEALDDFGRAVALDSSLGEVYYYRALIHEVVRADRSSALADLGLALKARGCPESRTQLTRRLWWLTTPVRSTIIFRARIIFRVITYVCLCNTIFTISLFCGSEATRQSWHYGRKHRCNRKYWTVGFLSIRVVQALQNSSRSRFARLCSWGALERTLGRLFRPTDGKSDCHEEERNCPACSL